MYLISFFAHGPWLPVCVRVNASFAFRFCAKSVRLSILSVHVVRGSRLVVSIRDSIVRGSGGSFYFVSAVIFDEGQIATRAFARRAGRLPRADHLKREGNGEWEDRENERWDRRGFHLNGPPLPTEHLCGRCTASPRFLPRIYRPFPSRTFTLCHPPVSFLSRLLSKCSNCVLSEPSINIPLNYSVDARQSPGGCSNFFNLIVKSDKSR